jgi:hypothetical protein
VVEVELFVPVAPAPETVLFAPDAVLPLTVLLPLGAVATPLVAAEPVVLAVLLEGPVYVLPLVVVVVVLVLLPL